MESRQLPPAEVLARMGGVARASQLQETCSRTAIRAALEAGTVVRIARGRYALPTAHEALVAATRLGGVASHLSAAQAWGWPVKTPPRLPHVTVPRHRRLRASDREGVVVHWADLPPETLHPSGRLTTPVRTVVDCARALTFDEGLCVADSGLRERHVVHSDLIRAAEASPRTGRPAAIKVARAADARAANPFESCLRAICLGVTGLEVTPQVWIGRIGRVDLYDEHLGLVIEADSWEHHGLPAAFRHDIRRYTALVREGQRVLRFCWEDVMRRPDYVAAVLTDMVAWGPPSFPGIAHPARDAMLGVIVDD